jgi:hypothetical protein
MVNWPIYPSFFKVMKGENSMTPPTRAQKIAAINGMADPALVAMLTGLGVALTGSETSDELKAKAIEKSLGGFGISFSSPIFNLIAALVAILMAGVPEAQAWGALIVVVVLAIDVIRTIRDFKRAGKTWKDWQMILKDVLVEVFAIVLTIAAVAMTDMLLLVFGAAMLAADAVTEIKK